MAKTLSKAQIEKKVADILKKARREPRLQAARERDALLQAIRREPEVAISLLSHGVDPNSTESKGRRRSALWYAVSFGELAVAVELVAQDAHARCRGVAFDVLVAAVAAGATDPYEAARELLESE